MKRVFPIEVVLSLTSGFLLIREFQALHEFIEHVAGGPVWTHEMAERALWERLTARVFAQHPELRSAEPVSPPSKAAMADYLAAYVIRARAAFGIELEIDQGVEMRTESPLESARRIVGDKPIVAVEVVSDRPGRA